MPACYKPDFAGCPGCFLGEWHDTPLKEALTALADALAKRPAEEIMFE